MKQQVTEYDVVDHGYDSPDHFQGCGVTFTRFDECVTGCGTTALEALDDALEQIAQEGYDISEIEDDLLPRVEEACGDAKTEPDDELMYYLSIRFIRP